MKNEPFTPPPNTALSVEWMQDRDELVGLPALIYLWGAFSGSVEILGWALAIWALGFAVWCLWTCWKAADRWPKEDTWRAVATLVYGGAPWLLSPVVGAIRPERLGLTLAFPLIFVPAIWAIFLARRRGLPLLPPKRRARFVGGAAALSGVWIVVLALLAMVFWDRGSQSQFASQPLADLFVALTLIAAFLAVQLGRNAIKGFTPHRPLTAEAILADPPPRPASPSAG
jgi:hypothetical protein